MTTEYKPGQMVRFTGRDGKVVDAEFRGLFRDRWGEQTACIILRSPGECPCQIDCKPCQLTKADR